MFDPPETLEKAQKRRYGDWAGDPKGTDYYPEYCAYELFSSFVWHQCSRRNGHGVNGLYCKQHAKIVEDTLKRKGE